MNAIERRFETATGLHLAGREWGAAPGFPVIALHGWLDNAGSFDLLAPQLDSCHLVALDAAGHGFSDFRSPDAGYNLWQDVGDVIDVADALGWGRFSFIGHSRGAAIGTLLAGAFPERIATLVLVEGGLPLTAAPEEAPTRLAEALQRSRALQGRAGRWFADRPSAIRERSYGFSKVTQAAAEILAARSLRESDGGWRWHADQRLKAPSEMRLTVEHVKAFVQRVQAPVLAFRAAESPFNGTPDYDTILQLFPSIDLVRLPGGHHFHLEGAEETIARRIDEFFRGE